MVMQLSLTHRGRRRVEKRGWEDVKEGTHRGNKAKICPHTEHNNESRKNPELFFQREVGNHHHHH